MSGPPMNADLNECECGRTLTQRTAEITEGALCVFCKGGGDE